MIKKILPKIQTAFQTWSMTVPVSIETRVYAHYNEIRRYTEETVVSDPELLNKIIKNGSYKTGGGTDTGFGTISEYKLK